MTKDNERHPRYVAFGRGFCWSGDNYGEADVVVKQNGNGCVYVSEHIVDRIEERQLREDEAVGRFQSDNYVAWCRYLNHGQDEYGADVVTIETCDSNAPGAFKVYRAAASRPHIEEAELAEIEARLAQIPEGPYFVDFDDGGDCPNHANSGLAVVDTGRVSEWPIARHCHWPVARWIQATREDVPKLIAALRPKEG